MHCLRLRHCVLSSPSAFKPLCSPSRLRFRLQYEASFLSNHTQRKLVDSASPSITAATADTPAITDRAETKRHLRTVTCRQQVDYTTLSASIDELQSMIPSRVEQVVQWHQQCLAMRLRHDHSMTWMYISWHPVCARINCGEQPKRGAPSEAYSFGETLHKTLHGLILTTASLPRPFERVVRLTFAESVDQERKHSLWCEVMGRYSNVILTDATDEIKLCAQQIGSKLSSVRQLQNGRSYCPPPVQSGIPPSTPKSSKDLREIIERVAEDDAFKDASLSSILVRSFQGVSPCLAQDLLAKAGLQAKITFPDLDQSQIEALFTHWQDWLDRVDRHIFEPTLCKQTGRYSLLSLPGLKFQSVHALLDAYYQTIESEEGTSKLGHSLRSVVKKSMSRLEAKRKKLQSTLNDADKAESMQQTGNLIIAHLHNYVPGSASLQVTDWESGETTDIKLDPLKTAVECAEGYFKKAKKHRRAIQTVGPLLKQSEDELEYMKGVEEAVEELELSDEEDDRRAMDQIREELIQGGYMPPPPDHHLAAKVNKKSKKNQNNSESDPDGLRIFTSPNGYRILIGRNNTQNDLLSKTRGKTGDLWFHARGVPGAHVLLKLDGKAERPDKVDIQCAAELAAYYSKARNAGKVTVALTDAENVSKPKGAPPGLVRITKERTIQVRPADSLAYSKQHDEQIATK